MKKIKETIVVEGKSDVATLANIISASFIITNGREISKETIELIRRANERNGVILFLDPDGPGNKIRQIIMDNVKGCKHAFLSSKVAKKGNKLGVAETDKKYILEALENVVSFQNEEILITTSDFYELGFQGNENSHELRKKLEEYYHIGSITGFVTSKTLLKRLNMLGITKEELIEVKKKL